MHRHEMEGGGGVGAATVVDGGAVTHLVAAPLPLVEFLAAEAARAARGVAVRSGHPPRGWLGRRWRGRGRRSRVGAYYEEAGDKGVGEPRVGNSWHIPDHLLQLVDGRLGQR